MRLREIETRVAKLEATDKANPLAGLSEEEIEHQLVAAMDRISANYDATAAALQTSSDAMNRNAAKRIKWFLERQHQQREYREWCAGVMAEQARVPAAARCASPAPG
ncbi:hypothetical protein [Methylobacterium sp. GC_Met_2]|uniref:hypothetical protein n=1 Tax=Methylobacterium sp. GC_Met_2 TaxID=2937376 RepID=UPI00226B0D09|nr:hypothetical protein [Methylobacterium sp. GC_Met_2]